MLKVYQTFTTPVGSNEQTGVNQATVTASGAFRSRGIAAGADKALFILNVSAISGTSASLTVSVQGYDPASGQWVTIQSFAAQTAVSASPLTLAIDPLYYQQLRVSYTLTGTTPSATFSCAAFLLSTESPR